MSILHRLLRSRLATIFFSIFLIAAIYQTIRVVYKTYETQTQITGLTFQINEGLKQREQLLSLQKILQSDFFAEREARVKLGMKKVNEYAVVIPRKEENGEQNPLLVNDAKTEIYSLSNKGMIINNPTSWWNYFFSTK